MDAGAHVAPTQHAKLQRWMTQAYPAYAALIEDVREIAGADVFTGIAPSDTHLAEMCLAAPGDVCWSLNKLVADPYERIEIARRVAARAQAPSELTPDPTRAAEFQRTGFADFQILTADEVRETADFLDQRPRVLRDGPTAHNDASDVAAAPHALKLATHPEILSLARGHLGVTPTIVDISAWWTDPTPVEDYGAHIFHRDRDDFRACKLFLYLTDVGPEDGPHIFARNTHDPEFVNDAIIKSGRREPLDLFGGNTRNAAHLIPKIFSEQISEITGPAGSCFLENTYGFHRGKNPTRNRRGLLQVLYSTTPYPSRLQRLADVKLDNLPADCIDSPSARYAARLLLESP